jgi:hypothetical protein
MVEKGNSRMGKSKSKNCLTIIFTSAGIVGLMLIVIWLGILWNMEADVEQLPPKIFLPFLHYPAMVLKDCGGSKMGSAAQIYEGIGDTASRINSEDIPACGLAPTDPQYCVLNNGALLDKSHIVTYLANDFWIKLKKIRNGTGSGEITLGPQTAGPDYSYAVTYKVKFLNHVSAHTLQQIGLSIWLDYERRYEKWTFNLLDRVGVESSFSIEDIPSTYLAYWMAVNYGYFREKYGVEELKQRDIYNKAFQEILNTLGGGYGSYDRPEGFGGFDYEQTKACAEDGECGLDSFKNRTHFMKVSAEAGKTNLYQCLSYPDVIEIKPVDGLYIFWNVIDEVKDEE